MLKSTRVDSGIEPIFGRAKNAITDSSPNLTSILPSPIIVVTLSKKEMKDLKAFSKSRVKDVEEGAQDVIGASYIIHGLLQQDHIEEDHGWCCLPVIAIFPGKTPNNSSYAVGGEHRLNWVLAVIFTSALVCLVVIEAGSATINQLYGTYCRSKDPKSRICAV